MYIENLGAIIEVRDVYLHLPEEVNNKHKTTKGWFQTNKQLVSSNYIVMLGERKYTLNQSKGKFVTGIWIRLSTWNKTSRYHKWYYSV